MNRVFVGLLSLVLCTTLGISTAFAVQVVVNPGNNPSMSNLQAAPSTSTSSTSPTVVPNTSTSAAIEPASSSYPAPPQGIQWGWQGAVLFQLNSAKLEQQYIPMLQTLAATLARYPDVNIIITGHTDNTGDLAYNRKLSEQRVASIVNFFSKQGVLPRRVVSQAVGEQRPTSSNACADDRKRNRRADLAFFPQGYPPEQAQLVDGETTPQQGECEAQRQMLEQVK